MQKFIFVTGGVCSSLGKGIASASIAKILKSSGFKISIQKLDPYLNVDPGTMSPFQHGEVFVLDDGAETDLDLGHYERFIDENLSEFSSFSTGKIYTEVLSRERRGDFLGGTIQVVPHIVDEIKRRIFLAAKKSKSEILVAEIGGTVGDIEAEPFLEAIRQIRLEVGHENAISVHLTLLPFLAASGELKTKPTQISVREIRRAGIQPEIILARADRQIPKKILGKIAKFCDTRADCVIPAPTVDSIYEVPLNFEKFKISNVLARELNLKKINPKMKNWQKMVEKIKTAKKILKIGLAGKYNELDDSYLSIIEALKSAGFFNSRKIKIEWIDTEKIEEKNTNEIEKIEKVAGIIVPGGFGNRGIEGKIEVTKIAREKDIPFFGICLGSQIMAIEFARNILKIKDANSEEFDSKTKNKIVHFLPGQSEERKKGGTLRLGSFPCVLQENSQAKKFYNQKKISERHRHRYEFNLKFKEKFEKYGFKFSGISPNGKLVEIVEIPQKKFFLGTQFHPEFLSRPEKPHPLFLNFVKICKER